ncbi:MAG: CsgG/HfaB family protein, partial [Candidatus Eiseniibacteriota bacterium]
MWKTPALAAWIAVVALAAWMPVGSLAEDDGPHGLKKMIAVADFEDKADQSTWHWTGPNPGDGMSDMLTTALVQTGKFRVIEREQLEHVLAEQQLGQAGITTPQTAAKLGQVLGVSAVVYGSISEFGYKKESTGGRVKGFGAGLKKQEARVACDVRIIDTSTAEILVAETYASEKSKHGVGVDTREFSFGHDSKFDETLVGKATREVIDEVVEKLTETIDTMPWTGRIVKADTDDRVYLNAGSEAGVEGGMTFDVFRAGEELIDPSTGLSLGAEETRVGSIEVTDVKEKYSIC